MIILLSILLCTLFLSPSLPLLEFIEPICQLLHKECLALIEPTGSWTPIYSALVCGKTLETGIVRNTFSSLGIIHLMVISGAHLIFLENLWRKLPYFRFKHMFFYVLLLIYSMSAGLRPPVLRALFSLLLSRMNKRFKLFWSPYWRTQISGILCLLCQHSWTHSLSLQLSWLASFGMCNPHFSRLLSCTLTYMIILPVISQWGGLHPFSIVINWLIAPVSSGILLPLSILSLPFPFIRPITDGLWSGFMNLVNWLATTFTLNQKVILTPLTTFYTWFYIFLLFICLQTYFSLSHRYKTGFYNDT